MPCRTSHSRAISWCSTSPPDAISQQDLAHRLGINRTIMVRLLDRLQEPGHVIRTRDPANRRTYVLSLTEAGRTALDGMRHAVADRDARLTSALSTPERRRLTALPTRLVADDGPSTIHSIEHLIAQAHYRLRHLGDHQLAAHGLRTRHFALLPVGPAPLPSAQSQSADRGIPNLVTRRYFDR
ncbi:MarR family transcriptional regulator [Streptosporangium sp. NPDC005286]|uniref:MarR family winged helix-turn-helix transcriptional regulator n=1 Tax=Streptosporangium sp. NPDC005286 TaxID=3154463 RepID=UPI0033BD1633